MKALAQRVSRGQVSVAGHVVGKIGHGFVVLLGVRNGDTEANAKLLAEKTANLRVFADANQLMNLSIQDVNGEILVISQFTLYADTRKGNRPSFARAAPAEHAETLYDKYTSHLRDMLGSERVVTGKFGAMMSVEIINDGPVTIELISECTD